MGHMEPSTLVIFGATGNLSRLKLMPSLYSLEAAGRLPERMAILAFARRDWEHNQWREEVVRMLKKQVRLW